MATNGKRCLQHEWIGTDYARNPNKAVRNMADYCAFLTKSLKAESIKDRQPADQLEPMANAAEEN